MSVLSMRSLANPLHLGLGGYTPGDLSAIYAEDLNAIKGAIGGGYLNPITLLTERWSIDTLSIFIQGTERIDGLGNATLRETRPEADVVYNLGTPALRWATVYAGNLVGNGAGLTNLPGVAIATGEATIVFANEVEASVAVAAPGVATGTAIAANIIVDSDDVEAEDWQPIKIKSVVAGVGFTAIAKTLTNGFTGNLKFRYIAV